MGSFAVRDIAYMPNGVEGLCLWAEDASCVLPLEKGSMISFKVSGRPIARAPRDHCALCDGTRCLKGRMDCLVPHVVYLTLFGRVAKVGVTKESRYERRIREQGAPFACVVSGFEDGLKARKAERALSASEGLKLAVRFEEKVGAIGKVADLAEANRILGRMSLRAGLELTDMRHLYQNPGLDAMQTPLIFGGDGVKGMVEDTRGEALYFRHRDNLYAYDLRRAIGRTLSLGKTKVEAQLTLENF